MSVQDTIFTRAVTDDDKAACQWVEAGAVKGLFYVMDVWDMFTKSGDGELTAAICDGALGGMGKLTRLYGSYGWLELLRVHPDYQRRGLGKAIYRRYMEQINEMKLTAVGMYTGLNNQASRGLAEQFGLTLRGEFCELLREPAKNESSAGFERVPAHLAESVAAPFYDDMGDFLVINRTFIPVRAGFGAYLGEKGWLYQSGGDIAVAGFRFQPQKNIHLAYFSGDAARAASLTSHLAEIHSSAGLSVNISTADKRSAAALENIGFVRQPGTLITLWREL